jgi:hypothetical protein
VDRSVCTCTFTVALQVTQAAAAMPLRVRRIDNTLEQLEAGDLKLRWALMKHIVSRCAPYQTVVAYSLSSHALRGPVHTVIVWMVQDMDLVPGLALGRLGLSGSFCNEHCQPVRGAPPLYHSKKD